MTKPQYKERWIEKYRQAESDLRELLTWDPFEDWEKDTMPESGVGDQIFYGLRVLYASAAPELAAAYLERGLQIAERTVKEDKCRKGRAADGWPQNHGLLLRNRGYLEVLQGRPLDTQALVQAAREMWSWHVENTTRKSDWEDVGEAEQLQALHLALIAGDEALVRELMEPRKWPFDCHQEEHALLKALAQAVFVERRPTPLKDVALRERFECFFDVARDPDSKRVYSVTNVLFMLELGAIRDKYFISSDGVIDWQRVVEAVSA